MQFVKNKYKQKMNGENIEMINLELYRIFIIVAKEKNITNASKILNISQPAVTKHIKNLESLLDTKLFERTNKGLILTDFGKDLYEELKEPMKAITSIDNKYNKIRNINIGSHNHLLNRIFGKCINEYYLNYENVNLNIKNFEIDTMLNMLKNQELDIVFSKKVNYIKDENIKYINLGYLNDAFIVSKDSKLSKKILSKTDLKNNIIYVPRTYSQTVERLSDLMDGEKLNLKNSSYNTILEMVSRTEAIGLITKEYIENEKLKGFNLIEVESELNLKPIEFGIYLNNKSFKELNNLIKIIKSQFKV